jgi:hypothetical protein
MKKHAGRKKVFFFRYTLKKYYRWTRAYLRRVRSAEKEIGGALEPC